VQQIPAELVSQAVAVQVGYQLLVNAVAYLAVVVATTVTQAVAAAAVHWPMLIIYQ
jgi:hypothetical protein